jgi:hypothetical protein
MARPSSFHGPSVRTTVDLPESLWRAAKIRAMDDHSDLRTVIVAALEAYLRDRDGERSSN